MTKKQYKIHEQELLILEKEYINNLKNSILKVFNEEVGNKLDTLKSLVICNLNTPYNDESDHIPYLEFLIEKTSTNEKILNEIDLEDCDYVGNEYVVDNGNTIMFRCNEEEFDIENKKHIPLTDTEWKTLCDFAFFIYNNAEKFIPLTGISGNIDIIKKI